MTPPTTRNVDRPWGSTPSISSKVPQPVHVNGSDLLTARAVRINLLIPRNRGKAKINRLLGNTHPDTCTAHESTCRVPYEIAGMIITNLTHDIDTLKACSLTCRSWYTLAVTHLHNTLTFRGNEQNTTCDKWRLLPKFHKLGLMPLVNEIQVVQSWMEHCNWFTPRALSHGRLRYFSAFDNVHTLEVQFLAIYRFMPGVEQCFGHFSPTLRSIILFCPRCTPRQLSHFLSLFSNVDNIDIWGTSEYTDTPVPETQFVPLSMPKLRGRLALCNFHWVETWTYLIASSGLRFCHMDLRENTKCAPILLEACAETLETLALNVTDCRSFYLGSSTGLS